MADERHVLDKAKYRQFLPPLMKIISCLYLYYRHRRACAKPAMARRRDAHAARGASSFQRCAYGDNILLADRLGGVAAAAAITMMFRGDVSSVNSDGDEALSLS